MRPSRLSRSLTVCALGLLGASGAGCASILEALAEEVAGEAGPAASLPARPEGLDRTAARSEAPPTRATTSEYQAGATLDWTRYRFGPPYPYALSRSLFERKRPLGEICRAAPLRLATNLANGWPFESDDPFAAASDSDLIADASRSERELLDNSVRINNLVVADENDLSARYIASAGRLGQQGHTCSASLFLHLWIWGDGPAVTLHR